MGNVEGVTLSPCQCQQIIGGQKIHSLFTRPLNATSSHNICLLCIYISNYTQTTVYILLILCFLVR